MKYTNTKLYKTESGLGGFYTLEFVEKKGELFIFNVLNPDHEHQISYTEKQAEKNILEY